MIFFFLVSSKTSRSRQSGAGRALIRHPDPAFSVFLLACPLLKDLREPSMVHMGKVSKSKGMSASRFSLSFQKAPPSEFHHFSGRGVQADKNCLDLWWGWWVVGNRFEGSSLQGTRSYKESPPIYPHAQQNGSPPGITGLYFAAILWLRPGVETAPWGRLRDQGLIDSVFNELAWQ